MTWLPVRKKLADEEFVDRMRHSIIVLDRFRPWLIAMHVGLLIGFGVLLPTVVKLCLRFAANNNAVWIWMGLTTGLGIGITIGWMFGHTVHGLIVLIAGGRSERLLVRYHDGLQEALLRLTSTASERDHSEPVDE